MTSFSTHINRALFAFLGLLLTCTASATNLVVGWNLAGNNLTQPVNVTTVFGNASTINSIWVWDAINLKWKFFTPSLSSSDLLTYAGNRGYDVLTQIQPGDGFWINSKIATALVLNPTCSNGATDYPTCTPPRTTAEGFWVGTSSTGYRVNLAVLENGDTWGVYSSGGYIYGALHGTTYSGGTTLSGSGSDFYIPYRTVTPGTYSGTFSAKGSLSVRTSSGSTFSGSYDTSYDQAASLATLSGTFSGSGVTGLSSPQSLTVGISGQGTVSASSGGCVVSGTATPRASGKNVFNVVLYFVGVTCYLGNGSSASGVGYYDTAAHALLVMGMKSDNSDGFIFIGTKL